MKKIFLFFIPLFPFPASALILNEQNNFLKLPPEPSVYFLQSNDSPEARFYPIKLVDDFDDTTDVVYSWWDGDGTKVYKREWDGSTKRSGKYSMKINYRKASSRYKFSFFAFQPNQDGVDNDFSKYEKLIFFLKTEKPLELIVKIQDKKSKTYEEKFSLEANKDWQLIEFNLSKAEKVNLKKVDNVFFFAQPGKFKVKGTFWIDDLYLITKQTIVDKKPSTPQIETFSQEEGVWTLKWQDEYKSGARLYEIQMADNPDFENPTILWTENNYLEFWDEPEYDYYRIRAWSNLPEYGGKSSEFSKVWEK
jgi:hypothetical protein